MHKVCKQTQDSYYFQLKNISSVFFFF